MLFAVEELPNSEELSDAIRRTQAELASVEGDLEDETLHGRRMRLANKADTLRAEITQLSAVRDVATMPVDDLIAKSKDDDQRALLPRDAARARLQQEMIAASKAGNYALYSVLRTARKRFE